MHKATKRRRIKKRRLKPSVKRWLVIFIGTFVAAILIEFFTNSLAASTRAGNSLGASNEYYQRQVTQVANAAKARQGHQPEPIALTIPKATKPTDTKTLTVQNNVHLPGVQSTPIAGIIMPLNAGPNLQQRLLQKVAQSGKPQTVILLMSAEKGDVEYAVQTSLAKWHTKERQLLTRASIITGLVQDADATIINKGFAERDGVQDLVAVLAKTFRVPDLRIVPIVLSPTITKQELLATHNVLQSTCAWCLVVVATKPQDVHSPLLRDLHQLLTKRALSNLSQEHIFTDTNKYNAPLLALLTQWAQSNNAQRFTSLSAGTQANQTANIAGLYETGTMTIPKQVATFSIAGDFMFARGVARDYGRNQSAIFSLLNNGDDSFFKGVDASMLNLEGSISKSWYPPIAPSGSYNFIFPRGIGKMLSKQHLKAVSLANNHSANGGAAGLATTRSVLAGAGIASIGGPNAKDVPKIATLQGNGVEITIIGVHALKENPSIKKLIQKHKAQSSRSLSQKVIVFAHWGTEYMTTHNARQERLAKSWVDAGADLIVGAHPHTVQDAEVYKGVPIVYSLGNFVFDQTEQNTNERGVQDGMTLHGAFTPDKLVLFGIPIELRSFKPRITNEPKRQRVLKKFYKNLSKHKTKTPIGEVYVF